MQTTKKQMIIGCSLVLLLAGGILTMVLYNTSKYMYPEMIGNQDNNSVAIFQIDNAGILIETKNLRIYIDPISITDEFADKPADIIFLTHEHADHFETTSIDQILTNSTIIFCPKNCSDITSKYNVTEVEPGSEGEILGINYTATYAYTIGDIYHRKSLGYCGYLISIGDYVIFHGGDSTNIPEYADINKEIDVMFMDLGHNKYTIFEDDAVLAIEVLHPKILVPVHTFERDLSEFKKKCSRSNPTTDIILNSILYLK